jgi:hypothetical protein
MDLPPGPSRKRSRSPINNKTKKTKILTDEELLLLLDNDKWLSSEHDFDDNFEGSLVDDFDNMAEVEEGNSNNDSHYVYLDSSTMNEMSDYSNNSLRNEPNNYITSWLSDPVNANYIPFTASPGLKCVPERNAPIDYFRLLVTDSFFDLLVEETNAYALDIFFNQKHESSRINNLVNTNRKEMEIFIGLLFHMGTIRLSRLEDYWKTSRL